ncbi:adenylyl-sulfate reductase subunit alpha [Pectinatus haikarae]|uniref:Adenylylsulfate reductase subunit A n=1 Tax=Pectinatus haikarae TaxID=349096 RepID=A0ABT9YC13_9FIRM|nr:adenylyl-sulfate reductase subunit alpha [Pectinatus haikarae]MDQ0205005.1 adenylylsulfate reductase subunit A [Pectinatus haikarae]
MENLEIKYLSTDILIAGGGTAGCYAALKLAEKATKNIMIVEKANIKRSGCLAAGVNALNAYITKGRTPDFYVDYAERDAEGIARGDLLLTMSERLNECAADLEKLGLVILKNADGSYAERGTRNIKINGENIKPILAAAVYERSNIKVYNHVNVIDFIVVGNRIYGAAAVDVHKPILYIIKASAVLCATGGAAGLYRPNNPGFSRHKMWYPPFNTGAGMAAGMRNGAEMTTLEMRFIALRCKDTIAPTGTIAQGVGAKQINSYGEVYETKYGISTPNRLYGTVVENAAGKGPCFLKTVGISDEQELDLKKAYLNMAPSQTLKWIEQGSPQERNVEIEGTEPYIVGGHAAAGFWISTDRHTTIRGLFAAGDTAGGCPQKYVTGAMAEADIAAMGIMEYLSSAADNKTEIDYHKYGEQYKQQEEHFLNAADKEFCVQDLEEAMQKIMDDYAGGIKTGYKYNEAGLSIAGKEIDKLCLLTDELPARSMHELTFIHELKDRLYICRFLIEHLKARKETRWHSFAENADYPDKDDVFKEYINSRIEDGEIKIIHRPIVKRGVRYEHNYQ